MVMPQTPGYICCSYPCCANAIPSATRYMAMAAGQRGWDVGQYSHSGTAL